MRCVVIGASAGGVEALKQLVEALPRDLEAALFVVVHFPPYATSTLPDILGRAGTLPAHHARHDEEIEVGHIYVACPDQHLLLERGRVQLSHGPRENGHRPAVDPLFRSAARAYGRSVISVVLSGNLDDGTAGTAAVHRRGGITVVQDPADAAHPGMPASALANVRVDHCVALAELPALLVRLVAEPEPDAARPLHEDEVDFEADIAGMEPYALHADERPGTPSAFSCPECQGVLWEVHEGELVRYRCRVGHAFSPETLAHKQNEAVETALWTAFQALKERAVYSRRLARRLKAGGTSYVAERFLRQAAEADARAAVIREVLREAPEMSVSANPEPGPASDTDES